MNAALKWSMRVLFAVGLACALFLPCGCSAPRPAPSRTYVESRLPGYHASAHFLHRIAERDIPFSTVVDVVENGERWYDPVNDSYIRWKDGVYVALTSNGVLKTVVRGLKEGRWHKIAQPAQP